MVLSIVPTIADEKLSELNALRAENWKLKYQLVKNSCDSQLSQLDKEQKELIDSFRKELNAKETDSWDWISSSFKSSK